MNDRRSLLVAVSCPAAVLGGSVALWLATVGPGVIQNSSANAIAVPQASIHSSALADVPIALAKDEAFIPSDDVAISAICGAPAAVEADAGEPIRLASADPSQIMLPEASPPAVAIEEIAAPSAVAEETPTQQAEIKLAAADPSDVLPVENPGLAAAGSEPMQPPLGEAAKDPTDPLELAEECLVVDVCVDRYLWALYQRTPKEDSIRVQERRSVTVKRRGKMVNVMRTVTRLMDEDFAWKDPKAADRANMPLMDYVIGGMDRGFKLKLFHVLHAAQEAGLSPGITSAFRDDYRQSIASGLKAASDRSYHGGSLRGGYGHGLAADVVSVKGATRGQRWVSTEALWKWIDANGKPLGIGRPYLDRDPPHVGPVDGQEYVSRRGGASAHAAVVAKPHRKLASNKVAAAREARPARQPQAAKTSRVRAS